MNFRLIIDPQAEEELVATVHAPSSLSKQIEDLVFRYSGADSIAGYANDEMRKLMFSDIECITIIQRKVIAIDTRGKHYILKYTLRELQNLLPTYFIRINKSALANEHRISRFETVFSGGVDAVFRGGYREYVSRRCFAEIKRRFDQE